MSRKKSFAEIVAEAKGMPSSRAAISPGRVNADGSFFDPSGNRLTRRLGDLDPKLAQAHVAKGALLAFEGCGCGGFGGCAATWVEATVRNGLGLERPRFVRGYGSPTWIDLWEGEAGFVVYAHGDVAWGDALA